MAPSKNLIVEAATRGGIKPGILVGKALAPNRGSVNATAKDLGVTRGAVQYWMRVENIEVRITTTTTVYVNGIEVETITEEKEIGA